MDGRQILASNLRRLRLTRGLSQERLAADAKIDRAYLGGIERRVENPTIDVVSRLATTLDVGLAELFREPLDEDLPVGLPRGRRKKA